MKTSILCLFLMSMIQLSCSGVKPEAKKNTAADDENTPTKINEKTDYQFFQNYFELVSKESMTAVDDYVSNEKELMKIRPKVSIHSSDQCDPLVQQKVTFGDRISYQIYVHASWEMVPGISNLGKYYGWGTKVLKKNSLMSHPMCEVTKETLASTLGSSEKVPSIETITQMNRFTKRMNSDLQRTLEGDMLAKRRYLQNWNKMMMCLAYVQSLTTADSEPSLYAAKKYAPNFKKPTGVEFYENDLQPETGSLNIGLYLFSPKVDGNTLSCQQSWNENFGSKCAFNVKDEMQMIQVLASGHQSFNAFCGVNKIVQTFSVQINTEKAAHTHPTNVLPNGSLKPANNRCVSPFFSARLANNHFGPLQNSYGNNSGELMDCMDRTATVE